MQQVKTTNHAEIVTTLIETLENPEIVELHLLHAQN
jgi:hypothetical protein